MRKGVIRYSSGVEKRPAPKHKVSVYSKELIAHENDVAGRKYEKQLQVIANNQREGWLFLQSQSFN